MSQSITVNAAPVTITSVTVKTVPNKIIYTEGETLDLSGLVVTLNKSNSTTEDVAFADFASKGITVNPANGSTLETSNTKVTISHTSSGKNFRPGNYGQSSTCNSNLSYSKDCT